MNNAFAQDTMGSAEHMTYTAQLTQSLDLASALAPSLGHSQVTPAHLLLVLLEDSDISFLLNAYGLDIKEAKASVLKLFPNITPKAAANNQKVPNAPGLSIVLNHAAKNAKKHNISEINSLFIFATLLREESNFTKVLDNYGLDYESVAQFIEMQVGSPVTIDPVPAYDIDPAVYTPPAPSPAMPSPAPAAPQTQPVAVPVSAAAPQASSPHTQGGPMAAAVVTPDSQAPEPEVAQLSAPQPQSAEPEAAQISAPKSPTPEHSAPEPQAPEHSAPEPQAPEPMAAAAHTAVTNTPPAGKNKVISFSNILKRQDNTPKQDGNDTTSASASANSEQPQNVAQTAETAPASPAAPSPTPIARPVHRPVMAQQSTPQPDQPTRSMEGTGTVSATGSVIEKGILIVPEHLPMEIGKAQIVNVRIAPNPQIAPTSNPSYDEVIMEAITTQLHAPGQNFHIKSLLPETYWIDNPTAHAGDDYGLWQWEVTPLQRGVTKLSIMVSSRILNKDNQLSSVVLPEKSIGVKVGMNSLSIIIKVVLVLLLIGAGIAAYMLLPKFM